MAVTKNSSDRPNLEEAAPWVTVMRSPFVGLNPMKAGEPKEAWIRPYGGFKKAYVGSPHPPLHRDLELANHKLARTKPPPSWWTRLGEVCGTSPKTMLSCWKRMVLTWPFGFPMSSFNKGTNQKVGL